MGLAGTARLLGDGSTPGEFPGAPALFLDWRTRTPMATGDRTHRWRCALVPISLIGVTAFIGCLPYTSSPGTRLLRQGEYGQAVQVLRQESLERPEDAGVRRNLGIGLYHAGETLEAVDALREARAMNPRDPKAAFYLGRACENAPEGDVDLIDSALQSYVDYLDLGGKGEVEVRSRIQALSRKKAAAEVAEAIRHEEELLLDQIPDNTLAVPDFVNVMEVDSLKPLGRGLAVVITTDLSKVASLRLLERARLQVLLEELELAHGGAIDRSVQLRQMSHPIESVLGIKERLTALIRPEAGKPYFDGPVDVVQDERYRSAVKAFQADHGLTADGIVGAQTREALQAAVAAEIQESQVVASSVAPETAPRFGKLLGARRFVHGRFVVEGQSDIQLDADLSDVREESSVSAGTPVHGPLSRVLHLEKELVYRILAALGIEPTAAERKEIDILPTEDLPAFLAFARGLELEDSGMNAAAAEAYRQALRVDPSFQWAATRAAEAEITPQDVELLDQAELVRVDLPPVERRQRLDRTGTESGLGPGTDEDRDQSQDPQESDSRAAGSNEAVIVVRGTVPGRGK